MANLANLNKLHTKVRQLDQARFGPPGASAAPAPAAQGVCVVEAAAAHGAGSLCDVVLGSGQRLKGVPCPGARLARGQSAGWIRQSGGQIVLLSGGGQASGGAALPSTIGGGVPPHNHQGLPDGGWPQGFGGSP